MLVPGLSEDDEILKVEEPYFGERHDSDRTAASGQPLLDESQNTETSILRDSQPAPLSTMGADEDMDIANDTLEQGRSLSQSRRKNKKI